MQRKHATISISGATITIALSMSASIAVHRSGPSDAASVDRSPPSVRLASHDADSSSGRGVELWLEGTGRAGSLRACVTLADDSLPNVRVQAITVKPSPGASAVGNR